MNGGESYYLRKPPIRYSLILKDPTDRRELAKQIDGVRKYYDIECGSFSL